MLSSLLIALIFLQIKHMLADYFFQAGFMLRGRALYWHAGRALHALVHAVGTLLAFLLVGTSFGVALALALLDGIIHFHIDWSKARLTEGHDMNPQTAAYWRAAGLDQAAHQMTYVLLLALWAAAYPA